MISLSKAAVISSLLMLVLDTVSAQDQPSRASRSVAGVLRTHWFENTRDEEFVIRELARLGPDVIEALFLVAAGDLLEQPEGLRVRPDHLERTSVLARRALAEMRERDVLPLLEDHLNPGSSPELKTAALDVLGSFHSKPALELLFATADGLEGLELRYRRNRLAFEKALVGICSGHRGWSLLDGQLKSLERPVLDWVIASITESGGAQGLEILPSLLDRDLQLDAVILAALADLSERYSWHVNDRLSSAVSPYLRSTDRGLRKIAAVALGKQHAFQEFNEIALLLEDRDGSVRRAAQWSLERMAGSNHGSSAEEWGEWYLREYDSWLDAVEAFELGSVAANPGEVVAAARGLTDSPLFRHVAAARIVPLLFERPELSDALCKLLIRLDSHRIAQVLLEVLEDADGELRTHATVALKHLGGDALLSEARR